MRDEIPTASRDSLLVEMKGAVRFDLLAFVQEQYEKEGLQYRELHMSTTEWKRGLLDNPNFGS